MIVAVAGGKGGVGKTTVSLNLAAALDAVAVDGDLSTADLPHEPGAGIYDVLAGSVDPLEAIQTVGSVDVLSCGPAIEGVQAATLTKFAEVVSRIERTYGNVVIDCPAGLARDVGTYIDAAETVVLVTTSDQLSIANANQTKRLAVTLETPISCVVLNSVTPYHDTTDEHRVAVESKLETDAVVVSHDPAVGHAQQDGQAVVDVSPDADVVSTFETVAEVVRENTTRGLKTQ